MIDVSEATAVDDELLAAVAGLIPQLSTSNPPPTADELDDIVSHPNTFMFVARDDERGGRIIGTLTLVTFRIPTGLRAWIEDVVVDAGARGSGAASALTHAALERARSLGARSVDLTSRPSREAANRLYQRLGFVLRTSNLYRFDLT